MLYNLLYKHIESFDVIIDRGKEDSKIDMLCCLLMFYVGINSCLNIIKYLSVFFFNWVIGRGKKSNNWKVSYLKTCSNERIFYTNFFLIVGLVSDVVYLREVCFVIIC